MITRRQLNGNLIAWLTAMTLPAVLNAAEKKFAPVELDNGRYTQDWFLESFLELADDLSEAHGGNKRLAILWEQDGCPYCREMHMVNFAIPDIHNFVRQNFEILQLDIWGSREITDFAGNVKSERALAKEWKVRFTPTIQFITEDEKTAAGNDPKTFEVARMPGYLRPVHFLWMFEFVRNRKYQDSDFRAFVREKVAAYEAAGKALPNW